MDRRHYDNERLAAAVRETGITYSELARRCGVQRMQIYRALQGKSASFELIERISAVCDLPATQIVRPRAISFENSASDVPSCVA